MESCKLSTFLLTIQYEHFTEGGNLQEDYLDKVREIVTLYANDFEMGEDL